MPLRCSTMPKNVNSSISYSKEPKIKSSNEFSTNLESLNKAQLLELLERQNKIIKSVPLLKLPDRGEKVKKLIVDIEKELEKRNKTEDISDIFNNLEINEKKVDTIEWGEKELSSNRQQSSPEGVFEEEENPFAILASHSGTNFNKKKVQFEAEEKSLITLDDIEEAYALNLCNKIDKTAPNKKFLPHKTLVSNSLKSNLKLRDLSAATPPPPIFGDTKLISLEESIKLQFVQTRHLKEVQLKHATERLKEMRYRIGDTLPSEESIKTYRSIIEIEGSDEEEERDDEHNCE